MGQWMKCVETDGKLSLRDPWLGKLQRGMLSCAVTDAQMLDTMRAYWNDHGYVPDPHTAVAIYAARATVRNTAANTHAREPVVCLATAHPCKFEEAVRTGLGDDFWHGSFMSHFMPERAASLAKQPEVVCEAFRSGEDWTARLRQAIERGLRQPQ